MRDLVGTPEGISMHIGKSALSPRAESSELYMSATLSYSSGRRRCGVFCADAGVALIKPVIISVNPKSAIRRRIVTPQSQFPQASSSAKLGALGNAVRLLLPSNVLNAAASLFFNSCQAASASFEPLQILRYAANDSSDGAKSAPSTNAISAVNVSFTAIKVVVLGASKDGVASPCSDATLASSVLAATAMGSSLERFINSAKRAHNCFACW